MLLFSRLVDAFFLLLLPLLVFVAVTIVIVMVHKCDGMAIMRCWQRAVPRPENRIHDGALSFCSEKPFESYQDLAAKSCMIRIFRRQDATKQMIILTSRKHVIKFYKNSKIT